MLNSQKFILRTNEDGTREASWRFWVLVWVTPVLFALAVGYLALEVHYWRSVTVETTAEVTHVYAWDNDAPQFFYQGDKVYSPRYRYVWTDGQPTEATAGRSHTDWNFEIGSRHTIRYRPDVKDDVILAGPSEWWVMRTVAKIMVFTLIPALLISVLAWGWLAGGRRARR